MAKIRGDKGFISSGEPRKVRSIRASDTTWRLLSEAASRRQEEIQKPTTIADLIQHWALTPPPNAEGNPETCQALAQKEAQLAEQKNYYKLCIESLENELAELQTTEARLTTLGDSDKSNIAIAFLTEALALRPNAGGAIKAKIREALEHLQ